MAMASTIGGVLALIAIVAARPHGAGPAIGALVGVALAALGGAVGPDDVARALAAQWPAYLTLASVMTMTASAERLGLLDRLAARIEPYTRGPVRRAFRVTFAIAALAAAIVSNDAAVLLLTPAVIALLRVVYPKRHPKFEVAFGFAIFAAAGVAPLVISNPMNLMFAEQLGLGFNRYAATMIPVALGGGLATYAALAWCFRRELADEAPALGRWDRVAGPLSVGERLVLGALALTLGAYPVVSALDGPLWLVAAGGGLLAGVARLTAGDRPRDLVGGVSWGLFPFLAGVFVLALALERSGAVDGLAALYGGASRPLLSVGGVSAVGSAVLNNHPMSVLNALALERAAAGEAAAFAALIGGDLGPRLLPIGSLAALLWLGSLRRLGVEVRLATFARVGVAITIPAVAASLAVLALVS